jgi:hypothetical protein
VSLARNIGYVPRSKKAARANVSFSLDTTEYTNLPETVTLNSGTVVSTSSFRKENFVFSILDDITVPVLDNIALFDNVDVYEGTYVTTNFTVNSLQPNQRFIIPNSRVDVSTIRVLIKPNQNSDINRKYTQASSLFNVTSESPVYWVQEVEDERYELIFGDGVFGHKLEDSNYIQVSYLITNGEDGNGIDNFDFIGKLTSSREATVLSSGISFVTTNTTAFGGASIESVESVKKYAAQIYASQHRAVTAGDYETLIPSIYAETESVSAFGGEELSPPQFGKVYISIKPINGTYLSNAIKDNIKTNLKQYSVAGIIPEIIDLKYLYIEADINAYFNSNLAKSANAVTSVISNNVEQYANSSELNKFGARFKYSKFLKMIDDSNRAITSNITSVVMRRDMRAALNSFAEYEICFGNRFYIKNHGHGTYGGEIGYNIKSSGFTVSGIPGVVYLKDTPNNSLADGVVDLIRLESPTEATVVRKNVGTIDYLKGEIKLKPINITSTLLNRGFPLIEISAVPYSNDVIGLQDLYLQLDINGTTVESIPDRIASGNDISGSNYIVSPSFSNGSLVRGEIVARNGFSGTTTSVQSGSYGSTSSTSTSPSSGSSY